MNAHKPSVHHLAIVVGLLLVTLCTLDGCSNTPTGPNATELTKPTQNAAPLTKNCSVLVPSVCLLPFPSSVFTKTDASTPSGLRVTLSKDADVIDVWAKVNFATHDGFSTIGPAMTTLPGGFRAQDLPKDFDASLNNTGIWLVNADFTSPRLGKRIPFQAVLTESEETPGMHLLTLTPLRTMTPNSRIAVILTNALKKADGTPHQASETMKALLADTPPDGAQKPYWTYYRDLRWLAEKKLGLAREDIVQMWDFPTRSTQSTAADLDAMVAYTLAWLKAGKLKTTVVKTSTYEQLIRIDVRITLPIWKADRDAYPARKADGSLEPAREAPIRGMLLLPPQSKTPNSITPIVFGHGLSGRAENMLDFASKLDLPAGPFAGAVIDWDLHGERGTGLGDLLAVITQVNIKAFVATMLQSAVDTIVLTAALEQLNNTPELQGVLKKNTLYLGRSMGGIVGGLSAAVHPSIKAFVLNVAGAGLGNIIRSGEIAKLLQLRAHLGRQLEDNNTTGLPKDLAVELLLGIGQLGFDIGDPMSFTPRESLRGTAPNSPAILLQESIGDKLIPNFTTETFARSMGLPLIQPSLYPVAGLQGHKAPTQGKPHSGLTQFRVGNKGYDAHAGLDHKALQAQVKTFLLSFLSKDNTTHGNITYNCKDGKNNTCDFLE